MHRGCASLFSKQNKQSNKQEKYKPRAKSNSKQKNFLRHVHNCVNNTFAVTYR